MSMANATTVQKRVLKALQNQAADSQKLLTTQRASGTEPTTEWTLDFQARATVHSELGAAAIAGGVPVEWVDQARERGTKGIRWNTNLFLRRAAPVDREALIDNLRTDIDHLARFTGIHAAYRPIAAAQNTGTAGVDDNLDSLWRRSAQLGVLLGVDADEARQLWPHDRWIETAASAAAGLTEAGLAHQWRAIAATDISSCAVQARALAEAGIDPDSRIAPPEPSAVLDVLGDNHVRVIGLFSHGPGAQIDAAIGATGVGAHEFDSGWTTQPVFSDPQTNYPGIEP
ncbi:hypothetical protein [Nocardia coubleae]|uniref:Uncharacterized protein n=1 Tax=Nocardia coubleae TaxID=356147 RepID=A0A846WCK1_9NOCA|nr:hypothetical protein [Nocardia coubleae]NKX91239.1 hypothetical protein [Nocardia coubleae]